MITQELRTLEFLARRGFAPRRIACRRALAAACLAGIGCFVDAMGLPGRLRGTGIPERRVDMS